MDLIFERESLKVEEHRLRTFSQWPLSSAISPQALARSGFYYIGPSDRVRCVFCQGILKSWMPNDKPDVEHKTHYPYCAFVQGRPVGNIPLEGNAISLATKKQGHIPEYADMKARLKSLSKLPPSVTQDKTLLADAGFFFTGYGDSMRCFYCGGALRSWQEDDDPWIEHAHWFPRCSYLRQKKGDLFVDEIEAAFRSSGQQIPSSPQKESPTPSHKVDVLSPKIQAVVEMGYNVNDVQKVYLDLKRLHGPDSDIDVQTLMTAVIRDQEMKSKDVSLAGTSSEADDRIMCKICMEREVEITFLPCGHLVSCEKCSRGIENCPVCRERIRGFVRTFLS